MKKFLAIALCAIMMLGLMAGCSQASSEGKLVMVTSADYPPYEFHMLDGDGKDVIVGIDISVAEQIAKDMGLELEVVDMAFENLLTAMDKGEADVLLAALEYTDERAKSVDFSDPYYTDLPPMILTKKANVDQFTSIDSFKDQVVGAQTSTTKADIVMEKMTGAELLSLSSVTDLVNNLVYDKCVALVLDGAVAKQYAEANPDLVICEAVPLGEPAPYRVCVQKGDPKGLLESINKTVAKITTDGSIEQYIGQANTFSENALEG